MLFNGHNWKQLIQNCAKLIEIDVTQMIKYIFLLELFFKSNNSNKFLRFIIIKHIKLK